MFNYTYKFKLDPKNPTRITLTPTLKTYAQAFAPLLVVCGAIAVFVVGAKVVENLNDNKVTELDPDHPDKD